jgi:hypothetical protein
MWFHENFAQIYIGQQSKPSGVLTAKKNPIFTNKIEQIYKTTYMQLAIICKLKIP